MIIIKIKQEFKKINNLIIQQQRLLVAKEKISDIMELITDEIL
jgi:hypothetical protein